MKNQSKTLIFLDSIKLIAIATVSNIKDLKILFF